MTNHFQTERLEEILEQALQTTHTTEMSRSIDQKMALRVLQWVQIDFEANPSAENYQRMELAMQIYQHWMKNVRTFKAGA